MINRVQREKTARSERHTEQQGRKRNQRRRRDYAGDIAWLIHWAKIFCENTIISIQLDIYGTARDQATTGRLPPHTIFP
jgi:hypothetical protein